MQDSSPGSKHPSGIIIMLHTRWR